MNKVEAFFVITRFKENLEWVSDYTDNYIVYNKGEPIYNNPKIKNVLNVGYNQKDIFEYSHEYYDSLPALVAFLQGIPFDQCEKSIFDRDIYNNHYTFLQWREYREPSTYWFHHSKYKTSTELMQKYFHYTPPNDICFPPGSQFIVEKHRILYYPRKFWKCMSEEMITNPCYESHTVERIIPLIFNNTYVLKEEYYD